MYKIIDKMQATIYEEHCIPAVDQDRLHLVWCCKTLQNYKAIFSLYDPEASQMHLFEATYNGDKQELYIDHYVKEENTCVKLEV